MTYGITCILNSCNLFSLLMNNCIDLFRSCCFFPFCVASKFVSSWHGMECLFETFKNAWILMFEFFGSFS